MSNDVGQLAFTAYEFQLRFTAAERAAIWQAASTDATVADLLVLSLAANTVYNDDPATIAGMTYLVLVGILSDARRVAILGADG